MKKIYSLVVFLCLYAIAMGQKVPPTNSETEPMSFKQVEIPNEVVDKHSYNYTKYKDMVEELKECPTCNFFGINKEININSNQNGEWYELPNNKKVWRTEIHVDNAKGLQLWFKNLTLENGDILYVYSSDKKEVYHRLTSKSVNKRTTLPIYTKSIIVELNTSQTLPSFIDLEKITIIFQDNIHQGEYYPNCDDDAGVNCDPWASDWCNEIRSTIKIVTETQFLDEDGQPSVLSWCSGVIVNNTENDFTPYILTANHCTELSNYTPLSDNRGERRHINPEDWIVYYNFQYATCGSSSTTSNDRMYTRGVEVLASSGLNGEVLACPDMSLLKVTDFDSQIPIGFNIYHAGWDNQDAEIGDDVVRIHHPSGGLKRIMSGTIIGENSFTLNFHNAVGLGGENCWYGVEWQAGSIPWGGSSGSPLFNNEHKLIGIYSHVIETNGEEDDCETPNNGWDGRLSSFWDDISQFLAPNSTSITSLEGTDPIGACQENIVAAGEYYSGNDWQSHNPIIVQAASSIETYIPSGINQDVGNEILNSPFFSNHITNYTYRAGNSIKLRAGFRAEKGVVFKAEIGDCQAFEGCGFNYTARVIPPKDILEEKEDIFSDLQIDFPNLKVYPNPNDGNFTIELSDYALSQEVSIRITNTMGQEVYSEIMTNNRTTLNVSHLSDGIYYLQINVEGETLTQKLVIAR